MRNLPIELAASTLLLGAANGWLLLCLHSERERAGAESVERARREEEVAALEQERSDLQREIRSLRRAAEVVTADDAFSPDPAADSVAPCGGVRAPAMPPPGARLRQGCPQACGEWVRFARTATLRES